ncbi:MAG: alanyl-tRNA editing protein [Spirochaetia bacterium]|nr:alanyl-tRNA editing protein [Spirochaetia bacterium]
MKLTKTLFLSEPYRKELDVTIIDIKEHKKHKALILDSTIFYPEGGGPEGDRGFIDETYIVNTIHGDEGEILHVVDPSCSLEIGTTHHLRLDWAHRYHYMVQHTAQHLISGILFTSFGIDTLSVHLSDTYIAIETGEPVIDQETLYHIEDEVNRAIITGGATHTKIVSQEDVPILNLRRSVKVETDVRIVSIEGYDEIACGGVHVDNISELNRVMYLMSESIRGHVRLFFLVSDIAKEEMRGYKEVVDEMKNTLSVPRERIIERVKENQLEIVSLRREVHLYQQSIIEQTLSSYMKGKETPIVMMDVSEYSFDALKVLSHILLDVPKIVLCAIKERDKENMNYLICIKGIEHEQELYGEIKLKVLQSIKAKGGGKAPLWQGIAHNNKEILREVEKVCNRVIYG